MCEWEEFIFTCSCSFTKRKTYCHFARNDPIHQCFHIQVLSKVWDVPQPCDDCLARAALQFARAQHQQAAYHAAYHAAYQAAQKGPSQHVNQGGQ